MAPMSLHWGMYAGKIRLMGTETGVGVHNAGDIGATAGNVVLTADGRIENSGKSAAPVIPNWPVSVISRTVGVFTVSSGSRWIAMAP